MERSLNSERPRKNFQSNSRMKKALDWGWTTERGLSTLLHKRLQASTNYSQDVFSGWGLKLKSLFRGVSEAKLHARWP